MTDNSRGGCDVHNDGATLVRSDPYPTVTSLTFQFMVYVDAHVRHNTDAPWNTFSSHDYWRRNYLELQAEDQEIIRRVSRFFAGALAGGPRVQQAIDVGSGTNLYPALLMLPWAEKILLTDFSQSNVNWLRHHVADDDAAWTWQPFWRELYEAEGYNQIGDEPRKHLMEACTGEQGLATVEQWSVFDLPAAQWDLGTMFFVAESITEDPAEFRTAVARFIGALKPRAPFAAAFMAGSGGYPVAGTFFPALPVTAADVEDHLTALGVGGLSVEVPKTEHRVRTGYAEMIVATGFACSQ
jgi:NNMT/PNMT/TEMT family